MSKTQRFRRLFLFSLVLWGMVGGLISLHICLNDSSVKKQEVDSCCCEKNNSSKNEINAINCCKTITCYVGIPLYFVHSNSTNFFLNTFQLFDAPKMVSDFNVFISNNAINHPPPDVGVFLDYNKPVLAMRI